MKVTRLERLNESHEMDLSSELLNMTVGEMLNKLEELDTHNDAEYEIIEDALKAVSDKLFYETGYESDRELTDDSIEAGEEMEEVDFTEDDDMPSFSDLENNTVQQDSIDSFEF